MPSTTYHYALTHLYNALNLQPPSHFDPVVSLQAGQYICNITEHPADHLLMFMELQVPEGTPIAEQNLFCQELCKPMLGADPLTGTDILWNRQPLAQLDRPGVHHQLEQLLQAAHDLTGG